MSEDDDNYVAWLDRLWQQRLLGDREIKPELSIGILLWPGFPMMSLTGIIEPLRHAADFADNSRPLYCRWAIVGEGATASCGVRIQPDMPYANPKDFDYIAVIGGLLPQIERAPRRHLDYIRVAASSGVPLIGVCTGVFVLAREGLLAGTKTAVHPFHATDFRMAFPRHAMTTREDYVSNPGRITVPGGVSILSLMTNLIQSHCGQDRAAKVVHQLALTERKSLNSFEIARVAEYRNIADARIQRAVVLIESQKGCRLSPDEVAAAIGLSSRQFTRLFRENLGMTPKHFMVETRLRLGRFLVENGTMSMTNIAFETGFADCAHFTTSFKARFGMSPRDLRTGRRNREQSAGIPADHADA